MYIIRISSQKLNYDVTTIPGLHWLDIDQLLVHKRRFEVWSMPIVVFVTMGILSQESQRRVSWFVWLNLLP